MLEGIFKKKGLWLGFTLFNLILFLIYLWSMIETYNYFNLYLITFQLNDYNFIDILLQGLITLFCFLIYIKRDKVYLWGLLISTLLTVLYKWYTILDIHNHYHVWALNEQFGVFIRVHGMSILLIGLLTIYLFSLKRFTIYLRIFAGLGFILSIIILSALALSTYTFFKNTDILLWNSDVLRMFFHHYPMTYIMIHFKYLFDFSYGIFITLFFLRTSIYNVQKS